MASPLVLVLGGTRSGKSSFGLDVARRLAGADRIWFLATAWAGDPEMDARIAGHRAARPADWPTIDVGADLAGAITRTEDEGTLLVDGFTLWLSTVLGDDATDIDPILAGPVAAALESIHAHRGPVVIVSDEVGGGIVPMHAGARAFRDLAGIAHQRLTAAADEAWLLVAGSPVRLKGPASP